MRFFLAPSCCFCFCCPPTHTHSALLTATTIPSLTLRQIARTLCFYFTRGTHCCCHTATCFSLLPSTRLLTEESFSLLQREIVTLLHRSRFFHYFINTTTNLLHCTGVTWIPPGNPQKLHFKPKTSKTPRIYTRPARLLRKLGRFSGGRIPSRRHSKGKITRGKTGKRRARGGTHTEKDRRNPRKNSD